MWPCEAIQLCDALDALDQMKQELGDCQSDIAQVAAERDTALTRMDYAEERAGILVEENQALRQLLSEVTSLVNAQAKQSTPHLRENLYKEW
jgi:hypothetical protein